MPVASEADWLSRAAGAVPGGLSLGGKLRVLLPFHNVEAYIEAALESIARQTFRDLEVVMVDDGSADGSTVIAKDFAARDPRFQLIGQRQQGDRKSTRLNSSHLGISYAVFCLKKR